MDEKVDALLSQGTWNLVTAPPRSDIGGCKWIFTVKRQPDGTVNRYKARLIVKGFI